MGDYTLSEMKASEMKKELESYGISTKSMFDRKEFEKALKEARLEKLREINMSKSVTNETDRNDSSGNKEVKDEVLDSHYADPMKGRKVTKTSAKEKNWSSRWKSVASTAKDVLESHMNSKKKSSPSSSSHRSSSTEEKSMPKTAKTYTSDSREQRYKLALEEGETMKLSDLKKELTDRGISTTSFFEKSDLIDAYACAIADNIKQTGSSTKKKKEEKQSFSTKRKDIDNSFDPRMIVPGDVIIDIAVDTPR